MLLPGAEPHEGAPAADLGVVAAVLAEAVAALDDAAVPYVLIGGIASSLHGRPRCTTDIDLLVKPEGAPAALDALAKVGFQTERTNPNWLFKAFRRGVLVDLLFKSVGDIYLDEEMLRRAVMRCHRGTLVRVAAPEDLIVMKAIALDEETPRHWGDALSILAATELDWAYLLERARWAPRRVLSFLLYATSVDVHVPNVALRRLAARVLET